MNRTFKLTVVAGAVALLGALPLSQAHGQGSALTVDPALAKKGRSIFSNKGCNGCHSIGGGRRAGPDLAGVTERRDTDWVRRFLKDPTGMLQTDSIAMAMLAEAKNVKMPNMKLTDGDIDALLHYITEETAKKKK
jgi:cbb3-type cytochrome oxidase cytochrome c subunit